MYKVLNYKISPPTINMWANWYITQWDNFIDQEKKYSLNPLIN